MEREALHYEITAGGKTRCHLCPHSCLIPPGGAGRCRVRRNQEGKLYTANYGRCAALHLDPMEKKPLYHFYPGSLIPSAGTFGCNLRCSFCQNWTLAHAEPETVALTPTQLVRILEEKIEQYPGIVGLAYTYSEPLVWYEFVLETARLVRERGRKNVLVTNGFIASQALKEMLSLIDAANVDIKGFNRDYYRRELQGELDPVLAACEDMAQAGVHLEITTLLVPGRNDSPEEIGSLVDWVADRLGPDTPLHFSRYFPNYKMNLPATPLATLEGARDLARRRLSYVYIGNAPELGGSDTFCPACGHLLIARRGYQVSLAGLENCSCRNCGGKIALIR